MKKRILSILLLCCMVLTLLPTAAFAAGELPDVKLSVPTTFDKIVDLTEQNKELKIKDGRVPPCSILRQARCKAPKERRKAPKVYL